GHQGTDVARPHADALFQIERGEAVVESQRNRDQEGNTEEHRERRLAQQLQRVKKWKRTCLILRRRVRQEETEDTQGRRQYGSQQHGTVVDGFAGLQQDLQEQIGSNPDNRSQFPYRGKVAGRVGNVGKDQGVGEGKRGGIK